jgi:hypothetical protein
MRYLSPQNKQPADMLDELMQNHILNKKKNCPMIISEDGQSDAVAQGVAPIIPSLDASTMSKKLSKKASNKQK